MVSKKLQFNWQLMLSTFALSLGMTGTMQSAAQAIPSSEKEPFKLAQVGIRDNSNGLVPLNLQPKFHIPLPTNSRSRYYPKTRYGSHRRSSRYGRGRYNRRHHDHYNCNHDHHGRRQNRRRGSVIIINPGSSSRYDHYSNQRYINQNGYIRLIRK